MKPLTSLTRPDTWAGDDRLPSEPFSQREHVKLLFEAAGITTDDIRRVKTTLLDALQATAVKDVTVRSKTGVDVQRVQEDIADHDVRLEAAEKLIKLFDLYPKKGSVTVERSNVVINPKFVRT